MLGYFAETPFIEASGTCVHIYKNKICIIFALPNISFTEISLKLIHLLIEKHWSKFGLKQFVSNNLMQESP